MVLYSKIAVKNMSESVYVGINHKLGTPQEVAFRREISDVCDLFMNRFLKNCLDKYNGVPKFLVSGSHKEGFRLKGSDIDIMS